ncbi:NUDIX domain-containing protein [Streptomyces sp. NPDC002076]
MQVDEPPGRFGKRPAGRCGGGCFGTRGKAGCAVWALPGGSVEPGEAAEQTAVREALEEAGLTVGVVEKLGERVHPDTG